MPEDFFKNHSDQELVRLCIEQLKYHKATKRDYSKNYYDEKENRYLQDLQSEIVNRFIDKHREDK